MFGMLKPVDAFLNRTTMFRLLVYYLGALLIAAAALSVVGVLPYDPVQLLSSALFVIAVCWLSNLIFSKTWGVPANAESSLITGLILALIITPGSADAQYFFLLWAGVLAMGSKYLLAIRSKHLFNPAALGVVLTAMVLGRGATWWVAGNLALLPLVLIGGFLTVRKIHRLDLVLTFIAAATVSSIVFKLGDPSAAWYTLQATYLHSSLLFFAFVMITEPLTTPPRRAGRIAYAALVGLLFAPWVHIGDTYFTPELALVAGNLFSYTISPKFKALLRLRSVRELGKDTYEFDFAGPTPKFEPGQYAEFTIGAEKSDNRGNRRYFTFSSSPTEPGVKLGVKFYPEPSTFKQQMAALTSNKTLLAGSIAGDFVLPKDTSKKLVFIAGGIGITPFRSMIKCLVDKKERRDIVLFYSNKRADEICYADIFDEAQRAGIGVRVIYTLTDPSIPEDWSGERGYVDAAMIRRHVPDFEDRYFYVSGPHSMVSACATLLSSLGVSRSRLKEDFFPGFA